MLVGERNCVRTFARLEKRYRVGHWHSAGEGTPDPLLAQSVIRDASVPSLKLSKYSRAGTVLRRREVIAAIAALAFPLEARAQQVPSTRRVGVLMGFADRDVPMSRQCGRSWRCSAGRIVATSRSLEMPTGKRAYHTIEVVGCIFQNSDLVAL